MEERVEERQTALIPQDEDGPLFPDLPYLGLQVKVGATIGIVALVVDAFSGFNQMAVWITASGVIASVSYTPLVAAWEERTHILHRVRRMISKQVHGDQPAEIIEGAAQTVALVAPSQARLLATDKPTIVFSAEQIAAMKQNLDEQVFSTLINTIAVVPDYLHEQQTAASQLKGEHPINYDAWYREDDLDDLTMPSIQAPGRYTLTDVLKQGFRPTMDKIFLGRLQDGTSVFVAVKDLCHVALAGLTGNGKGNLMRLIMAQLCYLGVEVLLLNPHWMPYDQSGGEDWTPFIPHLKQNPDISAKYPAIEKCLTWMTDTLLAGRIERASKMLPIGKPFFCVIDEWPAIVKRVKGAADKMSVLLREGRKYGIYVIVASQDFQVKTIGIEGGGVRKCFKTVLYVGGDPATARALLGTDDQGKQLTIPENRLGAGTIMMRCAEVKYAEIAQEPFVDNEALYTLVGPSTLNRYNIGQNEEVDDLGSFPGVSTQGSDGNTYGNSVETNAGATSGGIDGVAFPVSSQSTETPGNAPRSENLGVSAEKLETIKQLKLKHWPDREIAQLVKLEGRKYVIYKRCLEQLGYVAG